ncbi:Asp23/Gls24 family envelope stress response protein [Streptomyces zingiberis]|uniref:Asp23/Gls24 family envelope stress response protein n=1 Tax=Streptomyces zingiberis TaxID=2053010 RepID=A0ABX1BTW4_9ACTN|nr:Asp23/Gls24 family envelope stress response protein [Streptomyces zingiberis]NJQ01156.1 Asp23/Gls24 family envelope stress response protein [Streptomyces zingiberis]
MTTRIHPPDAPPPHEPDDERLPCGRLLSQVWTDWEEGVTDAHRQRCPHCRAAVADLEQLETAVRALRDGAADGAAGADAADGAAAGGPGEAGAGSTASRDADIAARLTGRVMDLVRRELRPGRPLPLGEAGEDLWIMESVAARPLRAAAEEVPGVRAGSCRIAPAGTAGPAQVTVAGRPVRPTRVTVRLEIHAPLATPDLPRLAERVRRHVQAAADRHLGLDVAGVDILVTDLIDEPDSGEKGHGR